MTRRPTLIPDFSSLPAVGIGLWQSDVSEDTAGELVRHLVERGRAKVVGRNERKDGGTCIGGTVQVAKVNFVEWGFADAEHKRTFLLEADVGGALNQVRSDAVRNAR